MPPALIVNAETGGLKAVAIASLKLILTLSPAPLVAALETVGASVSLAPTTLNPLISVPPVVTSLFSVGTM